MFCTYCGDITPHTGECEISVNYIYCEQCGCKNRKDQGIISHYGHCPRIEKAREDKMNCKHGYHPENCQYCIKEKELEKQAAQAIRSSVEYRFDIIDKYFFYAMAQIARLGSSKYGDYNWKKSRLVGDASPLNHAYMHLMQYEKKELHDLGGYQFHLAAAAFNLMMEYWYACHMDRQEAK